MARQINTVCNFILWYVKCKLLEDTIDVEVRVRMVWGTHTLKEDREYHTLKFKPWGDQVKPFEALQVRLSRYIKRSETVAATTTASVAPIFEKQKRKKESAPDNNRPSYKETWTKNKRLCLTFSNQYPNQRNKNN